MSVCRRNHYICSMKHLSLILAMGVLLLSVMPCCLEDKCLSTHISALSTGDDDACNSCDDCADNGYDCCSPFLHCNTCTGFPEARFYNPITVIVGSVSDCITAYVVKGNLPAFISSIWQPPQA